MIPQSGVSPDDFLNEVPTEETIEDYDLGVAYVFDYETGDFLMENGRLVEVTGIEAVKQWILKILKTEKFTYEIYEKPTDSGTDEFGIGLRRLIAGHIFTNYTESELKREIEENVTKHPRIQSLSNWNFESEDDTLTVYFTVNLIDGQSFNQEVTLNE